MVQTCKFVMDTLMAGFFFKYVLASEIGLFIPD